MQNADCRTTHTTPHVEKSQCQYYQPGSLERFYL